MAAMALTSPAFKHDTSLPLRYTADGEDVSPPLEWTDVPPEAQELVLIGDDPDAEAGVFTHWVVYGIAPSVSALPEGLPKDTLVDDPVPLVQGLNDYDDSGYTGPAAPVDRMPHRFFLRLFALDTELDVPPGATRAELRQAAKDHIIAQAELVGIT
jgi:Raf kinase inhibitor-like YbhB/YbcL family protein